MSILKLLLLCLFYFLMLTDVLSEEKISEDTVRLWIKQLGDEKEKVSEEALTSISKLPFSYRKIILEESKLNTNVKIQIKLENILKQSESKVKDICKEFYLKANQFYNENKLDSAIQYLNFIFDIDPENEMAFELKAKVLKANEDYKECILALKKLLTFNKNSAKETEKINFELVRVYMLCEDFSEAITLLKNWF